MRKQLKNEKGLTLVELLAVIVILGIIAAIAIPAIGNIITNSKYNAVKADAINVINAAQMYYLDNPEGEEAANPSGSEAGENTKEKITVEALVKAKYLETPGAIPGKATVGINTPQAITTTAIPFAKGKSVSFTNATITIINGDSKKGSQIDSTHTIGETTEPGNG
ncbi:hypothetical protein BI350_08670 [Sporosarcina ureilytica]|uniref:Tfp assembly type protein n=2 Tax=Sporosarcina ureilytica TaxID=298596 RepID=A0A1D8JKC5_9BACL|nr:hypothetical protein BI350_08670 [Sporosarcina ureilytica]